MTTMLSPASITSPASKRESSHASPQRLRDSRTPPWRRIPGNSVGNQEEAADGGRHLQVLARVPDRDALLGRIAASLHVRRDRAGLAGLLGHQVVRVGALKTLHLPGEHPVVHQAHLIE